MTTLTLSNVHPDQSDILLQLEGALRSSEAWAGNVDSQTGQGILSLISAIGAFNQAKINRRFQDSFSETVVSDRAAYGLTFMQGVRLPRKLPAGVQCNVVSAGRSLSIPAYTVFQGAGAFFFNREAVFLQADVAASVTLYEGNVLRYSMPGLGQPYSLFVSAETAFTVSDLDVEVRVNESPMARTTAGLWTLKNQLGFTDSTLPDGKLMIQFGTLKFGGQPGVNDTLYITYVVTNGADANSMDCLGKGFTSTGYPTVTGQFTSNPTGGANERSALTYKNIPSPSFGTFNSAINKQQHLTTALDYPGVVDALTFAQREVNPSALEWMNTIKVVVHPSSPWTAEMESAFLQYMQDNCAYAPIFILGYAEPENIDIDLEIYCYNWTNSTQARINVINAITALYQPKAGMLNYDLHTTDITDAAKKADPGIEYVILKSPLTEILISGRPLKAPTLTDIPNGGNLGEDTYYYGVQVTTSKGILATRNLAQLKVQGGAHAIDLTWDAYTDALSYQIYRKDTTSQRPGLIANVPGSQTTFRDINAVLPGVAPSPQNTLPVRYIRLNSLVVTDFYSKRSIRS